MRRVTKQIYDEDIIQCTKNYVNKNITKDINFNISAEGTEFAIIEKNWFVYVCFLFFFLIFPLVIYFMKRNQYKKYLNDQVNIGIHLEDYNNILDIAKSHIKNYDIIPGKNESLVIIRNKAVNGFPSGSIIDLEIWSNYYLYEIYDNYNGYTQKAKINYHYYTNRTVQRDGKTIIEKVRHDKTWEEGITEINIDYVKDASYVLRFNETFRRNVELESSIFNKKNKLKTNDQIMTRKIFTPACQAFFIDHSSPRISFHIDNNTLTLSLFTGFFYLTDKHIFSISDFKIGEEHMVNIIYKKMYDGLVKNNYNILKILALPIWNTVWE